MQFPQLAKHVSQMICPDLFTILNSPLSLSNSLDSFLSQSQAGSQEQVFHHLVKGLLGIRIVTVGRQVEAPVAILLKRGPEMRIDHLQYLEEMRIGDIGGQGSSRAIPNTCQHFLESLAPKLVVHIEIAQAQRI